MSMLLLVRKASSSSDDGHPVLDKGALTTASVLSRAFLAALAFDIVSRNAADDLDAFLASAGAVTFTAAFDGTASLRFEFAVALGGVAEAKVFSPRSRGLRRPVCDPALCDNDLLPASVGDVGSVNIEDRDVDEVIDLPAEVDLARAVCEGRLVAELRDASCV
jgi:hypothetical protein